MKLGLVQSAHNAMYHFLQPSFGFSKEECLRFQQQQVSQNLQLLEGAVGQGFDLLVTTECINYIRTSGQNRSEDACLYPPLECAQTAALANAAKAAKSWLVAGFGFREGERAYNGALIFDRDGLLRRVYRKVHLAGDECKVFTPGSEFVVQQADFGRFGVCVCWDMQFPETARAAALEGADLLVCPTWGWEADLYGKARAYENGIFAAAAMAVPAWGPIQPPRTPSSVISPDGRMLACGPQADSAIVSCCLELSQAQESRQMRLSGRRTELYGSLT